MKLAIGATTDVGQVRDGNEDWYLVDDSLRLFAIADGMGGHRAGEVASTTAIEALRSAVASGRPLDEAIADANRAVYEKAASDESLEGMGTTLTAIAVGSGPAVVVGHVGDSRAYLARDGRLTQITEDHSLVEEMVREGRITEDQALTHPQRSIITRALGIEPDVIADLYPVELRPDDRILICSDGLTDMVRPADIARILRQQPDPQRASEAMADAANAAGGVDNVTALVIAALGESAESAGSDVVIDTAAPIPDPIARDRPVVDPVPPASAVPPDTVAAAQAAAQSNALRRGRVRRVGLRTFRFLWWVLPIVLVVVIGIGAVWWHARKSFFVGINDGVVTVYRGVPGGLVGWDPTVERRTRLDAADLTAAQRQDLTGGHTFSLETSADEFVARLQRQATAATSTTSTSTTVPILVPAPTVPSVPSVP